MQPYCWCFWVRGVIEKSGQTFTEVQVRVCLHEGLIERFCTCIKRFVSIKKILYICKSLIAVIRNLQLCLCHVQKMTSTIFLILNESTNQQPYTVTQSVNCLDQPIRCMITMPGEKNKSFFILFESDTTKLREISEIWEFMYSITSIHSFS